MQTVILSVIVCCRVILFTIKIKHYNTAVADMEVLQGGRTILLYSQKKSWPLLFNFFLFFVYLINKRNAYTWYKINRIETSKG